MKLQEFTLQEGVLVRNWRITHRERSTHFPSLLWEPRMICSCGPFEGCSLYPVFKLLGGRGRKYYAENLLNSQAEVQSGLRSPSEPDWLVHPRQEEFWMQVMWRNRRQPRCHQNHCWATLWREQVPQRHHCHNAQHRDTRVERGNHHADSYVKSEHSLSTGT